MTAEKVHGKRWPRTMGAVAVGMIALALAAHGYALSMERQARDQSTPLVARDRAAHRAAALEPWNRSFDVTRVVVEAQLLLARGEVDQAYFLLLPHAQTVRGDTQFRETYQKVVAAKWVLDARKAHQQHAKENEAGDLEPGDVFK